MIVHNRFIYGDEEYEGSGLVDTVLSLVNGVIQHKDAIKDVVSVAKDAVNIGKDIKDMVSKKPPESENEIPEDVINIIKKIKTLSEGQGFRFV